MLLKNKRMKRNDVSESDCKCGRYGWNDQHDEANIIKRKNIKNYFTNFFYNLMVVHYAYE